MLAALQRSAGNAAVAGAIQRLQAGAAPPKPVPANPMADPRFRAVRVQVVGKASTMKAHASPKAEAKKAQDAAVAPANDKEAQAKRAQAAVMEGARPGGFDKAAFVAAVKAAIAAQAPKNLDEAESFATSGKAEAVRGQVAGKVTEGKEKSAKDIADKTGAAPDQSTAVEKPVNPLVPEKPPVPGSVDAAGGMPLRAPAEQTDFSGPARETGQQMAQAGVSEEQLARSNEPELTDALAAKKEGERHSAIEPPAVREAETATLGQAKQDAAGEGKAGLAAMVGAKTSALTKGAGAKAAAKSKDEGARAQVATDVKGIFDKTKGEVDTILGGLDAAVTARFDVGEKEARDQLTNEHKSEMARYKRERYGGKLGGLRWAKDLVMSLPDEANQIFVRARTQYEERMERLILRIADFIGGELTRAKDRIAKGRADIQAFVAKQPNDLRKVGQEAAAQFASQFDQLESDVDSKQDGLVDDLAARYVEARNAVDAEITATQEENKGLWEKAKDAVGGAIRTVLKLKDMLFGVLARAAGAIEKIIKDPIGFLGNLVSAVKGGILAFGSKIAVHLQTALQTWLFGALAKGGIELPEKLDLKGIIKIVLSILGMTVERIKARIAAKLPPGAMDLVEKGVGFIKVIATEGIGGLWKWVVEKVSHLQEVVMGQLRELVTTQIVNAGITWLISMLNPAAAFIKACKLIYDVVMFFVEKADQIKEFVDSILDSIESIAGGGVGAAADYIEKTLAKMLPVLLGFLASLLSLGSIPDKIKKILATVQKPIMSVVDKLVAGAVKYGKKLMSGAKRFGKKVAGKFALGRDETPQQKQKRLDDGVRAGVAAANRFAGKPVAGRLIRPILAGIKLRYRMQALELVPQGDKWAVHGAVNPDRTETSGALAGGDLESIMKYLTDPPLPELVLALDYLSPETHAFVTYPGASGHYRNVSGRHAEYAFNDDLRVRLGQLDPVAYPAGSVVPVTLRMNRTPCDTCNRLLHWIQTTEFNGRRVDLTVLATSQYGGMKWQSKLEEGGSKREQVPMPRSSLEALARLTAAGATLGVWDIWAEIGKAVVAQDPRLTDLDPAVLTTNRGASRLLGGSLQEVQRRLTLPRRLAG